MNSPINVIFINGNVSKQDIQLFCGPIVPEHADIRPFPDKPNLILTHLCAETGIFPSVSEVRRNGWNKPIPPGFSTLTIGKKRARLTMLNLTERWNEKNEN